MMSASPDKTNPSQVSKSPIATAPINGEPSTEPNMLKDRSNTSPKTTNTSPNVSVAKLVTGQNVRMNAYHASVSLS